MIKKFITSRLDERTSWDGAALIALGIVVLIAGPFAKLAAYAAIAYGAWTIWKKENQNQIQIIVPGNMTVMATKFLKAILPNVGLRKITAMNTVISNGQELQVMVRQMEGISKMITITESAKQYLDKVRNDDYVTLGVKGGGCSGFTYVWDFKKNWPDVDWSEPYEDALVLDPMAEMFVAGCTIDYKNELGGSYLTVINPNATATCGCGESFAA